MKPPQIHEAEGLQTEVLKQRKLLDQTASCLGLSSAVVLDELQELREQVNSFYPSTCVQQRNGVVCNARNRKGGLPERVDA